MQGTDRQDGRQAKRLWGAPDFLTAIRVPLALAFVLIPGMVERLIIVAIAAATDFADGFWARRVGGSRVGAVLDPIADKLFMLAAFVVVLASGRLHPLEIGAVLLRDIVAFLAFLTTAILGRPTTLPARAGGKAVTVVQLLTLVAFLAESEFLRPLAWATGAVSVYAIADYTRVGLRGTSKEPE